MSDEQFVPENAGRMLLVFVWCGADAEPDEDAYYIDTQPIIGWRIGAFSGAGKIKHPLGWPVCAFEVPTYESLSPGDFRKTALLLPDGKVWSDVNCGVGSLEQWRDWCIREAKAAQACRPAGGS